jgi:hypothetical protein
VEYFVHDEGEPSLLSCSILPLHHAARAGVVSLNFDDLPAGTTSADAYMQDGLYFDSDGDGGPPGHPGLQVSSFLILASSAAVSPPNIARGLFSSVPDLEGFIFFQDLFQEYGSFVEGTTDFVSFDVVGTHPGQTDPWTAVIYGLFNADTGTWPILGQSSGVDDSLVTFQTPGINRFILFPSSSFEGIDNLSVRAPITPEPATFLLALPIIGLFLISKRQIKQAKLVNFDQPPFSALPVYANRRR